MQVFKPVITVYEQELLSVGDRRDDLVFNENHLHQLAMLQSRLPVKLYNLAYRAVRFTNIVGVIQLPEFLIEIFPKISSSMTPKLARKAWTQLLHQAGYLPHLGDLYPQLLTQPGAMLNVLQSAFLKEVNQLVRQGLVKQYRSKESQQPFLRGKLLLSQQIRHNLIRKDRFYVRSQVHQHDHLLNQRLKQALRIVESLGNHSLEVSPLLTAFQQVTNLPPNYPWDESISLNLNRLTRRYEQPLALAKLICQGYLGGTFIGEDVGFSLRFDMSQVYETLIHRYLQSISQKQGWALRYQPSQYFWRTKQLRPDFIIDLNDKQRVVIDTKWKILTQPEPSDDDLRQIFTYTQIFNAQRGILLYPNLHDLPPAFEQFSGPNTESTRCEIEFVSLLEDPVKQLSALLLKAI